MLWHERPMFLPNETINLLEENTSAWAQKNTSVRVGGMLLSVNVFVPLNCKVPWCQELF